MKAIFKYDLPINGQIIEINACIKQWLDIQNQNGSPKIWAIVDPEGEPEKHLIAAWGTGWGLLLDDEFKYIGTVQDGAGYVWHYFHKKG